MSKDPGLDGFGLRLDAELSDVPPAELLAGSVAAGRRALRRRRALTALGGLGAAAVVAGSGAAAFSGIVAGADRVTRAEFATMPESDIVVRCGEAENTSGETLERLYGPGTPDLMATATGGVTSHSALRSADGRYWAECFLRLDEGGEFGSGLTLYRADPAGNEGLQYGFGPGCRLSAGEAFDPGCDKFSFHMVDRRPEVVAKVRVVTADEQVTWAPTNEGYFAVDVVGRLPEGVRMTEHGLPDGFQPLRSIGFYAADGELLAEKDFTREQHGPDGEEHEPLDEYPSLAGDPA